MSNIDAGREIEKTLRTLLGDAKVSKPTLFSLPPCYCGGKAKFEDWAIGGEVFYRVICDKCENTTDWYGSVEESSVAWQDMQEDIDKNINGS